MGKEQKPRYPMSFFFFGLFLEMIVRRFYLFVPAVIFAIVAIFVPWAITLSLVLLAVDFLISLAVQLMVRHTILHDDDPNFAKWRDAMLSGDWRENLQDLADAQSEDGSDDEDPDEDPDEASQDRGDGAPADDNDNGENDEDAT